MAALLLAHGNEPMGSIKSRLILALGIVQLSMLAMALVLYVGASRLDDSAHLTRRANDEVRELLAFALVTHRYMNAFGQSLGQRTLIANHDRRRAAAEFEARIESIDAERLRHAGWQALNWSELKRISTELSAELRSADSLREQGKFYEAERTFAIARKTHFDQRMLPWFDTAIERLRGNVRAIESDAIAYGSKLRIAGAVLGVVSALLATATALSLSSSILKPVASLVTGTEQIARGNLDHRVAPHGPDELSLLAERFNQMAAALSKAQSSLVERHAELEAAYQLQSEFLSIVSHELRSPLHSILGYTDLVLEDEADLRVSSKRNVLAIATSAKRLLALINDILDFSKLKAGRMESRSAAFDLERLLRDVLRDAHALVQARPLELMLDAPRELMLDSDEGKVRQVLTNLVSNAIKFTDSGSVTLRASSSPQGIQIDVIDTGFGIADDQLGLIFEPFRQASRGTHHALGGTGLGLAIVSRLVDLLGGRVTVESEVGKGTRFSVSLPDRNGKGE